MKIREEANAQEVRSFYREDLERRVRARVDGNLRIERAIDFLLEKIREDQRVLDIGCGIGIATERMARRASAGQVWGVDISPAHIDYCKRTIDAPNVQFALLDVLEEFDRAHALLAGPVDVITMIDVIEHLPLERSHDFFSMLPRILSEDASVLLTYPSPEYQRKLYEESGRIQAVDLVLEIDDILALASSAGLRLRTFRYVDVWQTNQYIHCELVRSLSCERFDPRERALSGGLEDKARFAIDTVKSGLRTLTRATRRKKYIEDPLQDMR